MEIILFTPKHGHHTLLIDDCDFPKYQAFHRGATGGIVRGRSGIYYVQCRHHGKDILLHRWLMDAPRGVVVDHIDGNGLNNRRSNLRLSTHSQNMANSKIRATNKLGLKGVYIRHFKTCTKYRALIMKDRMRIDIGHFDTATEAAIAYNNKAISLFGQFAKLNQILR